MPASLVRDSSVPLYHQLAKLLAVEARKLEPGQRFLTDREIVDCHEVSRFTVTRAINHLVDQGLLYRRRGSGTYVKERPQALHTPTILLAMPKNLRRCIAERDYMYGDLVQGVIDGVGHEGNVILLPLDNPDTETDVLLKRLRDPRVDAAVLLPWQNLMSLVNTARSHQKAVVLLNAKQRAFAGLNRVLTREGPGMRLATEHLLELGHRRFVFVRVSERSSDSDDSLHDRYAHHQAALNEHGLGPEADCVVTWRQDGPAHLRRLLAAADRPTALVCISDFYLRPVLDVVHEVGLQVPRDLSIVSFDDAPFAGELDPPITTVHKPRYDMGRRAAQLVLQLAADGTRYDQDTYLDPHLILRQSTTAPLPS